MNMSIVNFGTFYRNKTHLVKTITAATHPFDSTKYIVFSIVSAGGIASEPKVLPEAEFIDLFINVKED